MKGLLAHNKALDVAEEAAKTSWEAVVAKEDVGGLKEKSVSSSSSFDNDISIDVAEILCTDGLGRGCNRGAFVI